MSTKLKTCAVLATSEVLTVKGDIMIDELIASRMARLQELRQYQAHYGPHTPYPIVLEINQLEGELGHLLRTRQAQIQATQFAQAQAQATQFAQAQAQATQFAQAQAQATQLAQAQAMQTAQVVPATKPPLKKTVKKTPAPAPPPQQSSQIMTDILSTIAFIGFVLFLGGIVFATYQYQQNGFGDIAFNYSEPIDGRAPTLRPTFTPTMDPQTYPASGVVASDTLLPTPSQATAIPTLVPTITPHSLPTLTPVPQPTATQKPPPRPAQPAAQPRPANSPTPSAPPPTPAPSYPFVVSERGNREFQKTSYHVITMYIGVVSEGNIPLGGYKVVGNHVPSGAHAESGISQWGWSVVNCLDCDYVKEGNLKFEPGSFSDGVWNVYLADPGGRQLSAIVPLNYSSNPDQWVWDFLTFRRITN